LQTHPTSTDLASPECVTGNISYLARWSIQVFVPLVTIIVLFTIAMCKILDKQRVFIVISFIAQLVFIFGGLHKIINRFGLEHQL